MVDNVQEKTKNMSDLQNELNIDLTGNIINLLLRNKLVD